MEPKLYKEFRSLSDQAILISGIFIAAKKFINKE